MTTLAQVGLDKVIQGLAGRVDLECVGEPCLVLGQAGSVGSSRPVPSSAIRLRLGDATTWVPAPELPPEPTRGLGPIYRHADRLLVLPAFRLFPGDPKEHPPEFLTLSHWLEDAFVRWQFPVLPERSPHEVGTGGHERGAGETAATIRTHLEQHTLTAAEVLLLTGTVIRYALFGSARFFRLLGLGFPNSSMWLRPLGSGPPTPFGEGSAFAREAIRSLVVTVRLGSSATPGSASLPSRNLRAAAYRIQPASAADWGIDPVQTPEGNEIRLVGRLGHGVGIGEDRRLKVPDEVTLPLALSASRLPFAGYNDPRRLLMATNMQTQAVPLPAAELPRVRRDLAGPEPPGINLRVAYLAWQGLNHEDAWVLSASAAARLKTEETLVQTAWVRTAELPARVLVAVGQQVELGDLLLERSLAPALLTGDVAVLAHLPDLDERLVIEPESDDRAQAAGLVCRIDTWDILDGEGIPEGCHLPPELTGQVRTVYRFHLKRSLPLEVGDKLANRHGHKGIVGAILADEEMPTWRGQPADVLIDPISVLNRSNWGQVYEVLASSLGQVEEEGAGRQELPGPEVLGRAGEVGADEHGRFLLDPPALGHWLTSPLRALAGWQFVMRMPQHAQDKISASPRRGRSRESGHSRTGPLRFRMQRFGEMDHWALWAHGSGIRQNSDQQASTQAPASAALAHVQRLLASAGFQFAREGEYLVVRRLALDADPPPQAVLFPLSTSAESSRKGQAPLKMCYDRLEQIEEGALTVLAIEPPLECVPGQARIRWVPLLPARDRPPRQLGDGSMQPHELTRDLRRLLGALRKRTRGSSRAEEANRLESELGYAVRRLMEDAYLHALGRTATGPLSSKFAALRRQVMGRRLLGSARATIAPAGPMGLGLDEVALPQPLLEAIHPGERNPARSERWLWIKRDPVLHRWGLLAVRARAIPENVIRLPASLLGPMGADFDGDTVAVFGQLPGVAGDLAACRPSVLAQHDITQRALFVPGKQYLYGLVLLQQDARALADLQQALRIQGAPAWPGSEDASANVQQWVTLAGSSPTPDGAWWATVEQHALRGLARDPAMGLGLLSLADLANLPVVQCGAAKNLYEGETAQLLMEPILQGRSLDCYEHRGGRWRPPTPPWRGRMPAESFDPIAAVMVSARTSVGRFGGALRRLLFGIEHLSPGDVRYAQCLTEQVTQKALSIKAGRPPLSVYEFERQLRLLLAGQPWQVIEDSELTSVLASLPQVWEGLRGRTVADPPAWLEWLRKPQELNQLLARHGELRLPLEDLRLWGWTEHK